MSEHQEDSLLRRQTDPAWLHDHHLATGHTENTNSATFTFIKRNERIYAVTCGHVVDQLRNPGSLPGAHLPTLALQIDRSVLNLSRVTGVGHVTPITLAAEKNEDHREVDIAIAPLPENFWSLLTERKNKTAIDLDAWREPRWQEVRMCVAAGYPNEHKKQVEVEGRDMVSAGFLCARAEVSSELGRDQKFITLSSRLDKPHSYYFSGMSGGPVYAFESDADPAADEDLFPIGIIFEGYPSSGRGGTQTDEEPAAAFLTDRDIFFRALTLTPESFDYWLTLLR